MLGNDAETVFVSSADIITSRYSSKEMAVAYSIETFSLLVRKSEHVLVASDIARFLQLNSIQIYGK